MVVIASILSVRGQITPSSFLPLLNARCSHIGTAKLFANCTVQGAPRWGAAGQPVLLLQVLPGGRWQKVLRGSAVTAFLLSSLPCPAACHPQAQQGLSRFSWAGSLHPHCSWLGVRIPPSPWASNSSEIRLRRKTGYKTHLMLAVFCGCL